MRTVKTHDGQIVGFAFGADNYDGSELEFGFPEDDAETIEEDGFGYYLGEYEAEYDYGNDQPNDVSDADPGL